MTNTETRRKRENTLPALAIALVVGLLWVAASVRGSAESILASEASGMGPGYGLGIVFGSAILPAIIIWLVLFFAWVKARQPDRALIYFVVIAIALTFTNCAATTVAKGVIQRDGAEAQKIASDLLATSRDVAKGGSNVDRTPKSQGAMREIEAVARGLLADAVADRDAYTRELAALGFPDRLTPARLKADPGQRAALTMLDGVRDAVAKYQRRDAERMAAARAKVAALPQNGFTKGFLEGYDRAQAQGGNPSQRAWRLEAEMVDEHRKAVEALRRSAGRWQVQGDGYVFERQADLDAWRVPIQRIETLAAEQERLSTAAVDAAEKKLSGR